MNKPSLSMEVCGVKFKNPVIAASGTYGFGREYEQFYDISSLGGISVKGLTLEMRQGNAPPRIAETPAGMLNSVGLQNPGVEAFIREDLPWLLEKDIVVIANIAGNTSDDYCRMAERISQSGVHMQELNISCPNVKQGGMAFGSTPDNVYEITRAVRVHCAQPLIVKLSPNVADIALIAQAAQQAGADAVSLINTITGMAVDVHNKQPILKNIIGGLSGPAVRPVALRMVWQAASAVEIPVIGMGGIEKGEDAAAFMLCGAQLVSVGTANIAEPMACPRIIGELSAYLEEHGHTDIKQIIGALDAPGTRTYAG